MFVINKKVISNCSTTLPERETVRRRKIETGLTGRLSDCLDACQLEVQEEIPRREKERSTGLKRCTGGAESERVPHIEESDQLTN